MIGYALQTLLKLFPKGFFFFLHSLLMTKLVTQKRGERENLMRQYFKHSSLFRLLTWPCSLIMSKMQKILSEMTSSMRFCDPVQDPC